MNIKEIQKLIKFVSKSKAKEVSLELKDFKIMSWNIGRGLIKKLSQIRAVLLEERVGICFLIETDDSQNNLQSIKIADYSVHTSTVLNVKDKVRIIALVHNDLTVKIRSDLMSHEVSTIWMELKRDKNKNVLVAGIYREWTDNEESDCTKIVNQIQKASEEKVPLLVTGDINLDMLQWSKNSYYKKSIADTWKSSITKSGLKWENLGITYTSHYMSN